MNKIILKKNKELIGVSNIVISEIDNKIFINNSNQIHNSTKGSMAVYTEDNCSSLEGAGPSCQWNSETLTLEVTNINTEKSINKRIEAESIQVSDSIHVSNLNTENSINKRIKAESIQVSILNTEISTNKKIEAEAIHVSEFFETEKIAVKKWIGFASKKNPNEHPFKISLYSDRLTGKEYIVFIGNEYKESFRKNLIIFDEDRIRFNQTINIKQKTPNSSIGNRGDLAGDINFDENFIYYCTKDFDGESKIWKRVELSLW